MATTAGFEELDLKSGDYMLPMNRKKGLGLKIRIRKVLRGL